jgi:predicted small integral membrane protein
MAIGESAMHVRYLKILFAVITALMCLIYVGQNFANTEAAHGAMIYVMSGADHAVYTNSIGPKFTNPAIAWFALILVFAGELAAGLMLGKGALDMWRARRADAETFKASKKWAMIGCGVGVLVWFGFFGVFGAALLQMWQTEVGTGSMNGAFQYFMSCAVTLLFLNQND